MNQGDLFSSRARVALADLAAGVSGFGSISRPELAQLSSMSPVQDIGPAAARTLRGLPEVKNQLQLQGLALKAFWEAFSASVELRPVAARLMVNPPLDLGVNLHDGVWMTLSTQSWLTGRYGISACAALPSGSVLPRDLAFKVSGEMPGYFDDVAIFWDHEVDPVGLAGWVVPGSTLTLCRPLPAVHAEWIRWIGLDFSFPAVIGALEASFKLSLVSRQVAGQVEHSIIGVEAK